MTPPDLNSEAFIRACATDTLRWPASPWNSPPGAEAFYRKRCTDLCRRFDLTSQCEWNHYGSGYASYIDAWFYRDTPEFRVTPSLGQKYEYIGLWILFHRLSPYYVMGQGWKSWDDANAIASRYMPRMDEVDRIESNAVLSLSSEIQRQLSYHGLIRLNREDVAQPIPHDIAIETVLSDAKFHLFDALYHWMD